MSKSLPKSLIAYIEEMGVHALDHLAEKHHTGPEEKGAPSAVVAMLVEQWQALGPDDKQRFVERVVTSVANVIASSARLPTGLRVGAKAVKSAAKVMKKQRKALKKEAKLALEEAPKSRTKADDRNEFEVPLSDLVRVRDEQPKRRRPAKAAAPAKKKTVAKSGAAKGAAAKGPAAKGKGRKAAGGAKAGGKKSKAE